ncbi:MAG: hemolysin family protein [Chloroflexota bacterium]
MLEISVITILILLNGMFVAAEFAIVAVPRMRVKKMAADGSGVAKRILAILNDPEKQNNFITTSQVGITIASLGLGMYGENVLAEWFLHLLGGFGNLAETISHTLATILAVGLLTYLHVVIGEMIPKSLALQSSIRTVSVLVTPIKIIEKLFSPLVWLLTWMSMLIMRMLGFENRDQHSKLFTPAELEYVVAKSSKDGVLEESDQLFIENIFDLRDRTAEQVMTPRNRLSALDVAVDASETMVLVCEQTRTRYPVYDEEIDNVIGILHIKDLIRHRNDANLIDLHELLRPTIYIPESFSVLATLTRFKKENIQMAIVVDEFGGTAGVVTLEDLIEEVVGEIQDEFDEETAPIEELSRLFVKVRGDVILEELNQHYDLGLSHPEANTIGGLVMAVLGRIPEGGEEITLGRIKIQVTHVDNHTVQRVLMILPKEDKVP